MSIKQLTETDCQINIQNEEYRLKITAGEKEKQKVRASIMIWERMLHHIKEGRKVFLETKDGEEYLQLED
jgi:hypothetical protein